MASIRTDSRELEAVKADLARAYYADIVPVVLDTFADEVPVDTGRMRRARRARPLQRRNGRWVIRFAHPTDYDIYVHQGTRGRTVSTSGAVSVSRLGATVVARRVGGITANPWMARSFRRLGFQSVRWIRAS